MDAAETPVVAADPPAARMLGWASLAIASIAFVAAFIGLWLGLTPSPTSTLIDENPPLVMADPDSSVRAAVCRAFGEMGDKAKLKKVGDALLEAMEKDLAEEVRRDAYQAFRTIAGSGVPDYNAVGTAESRADAVEKIRSWFSTQGWKDQT